LVPALAPLLAAGVVVDAAAAEPALLLTPLAWFGVLSELEHAHRHNPPNTRNFA
jgi:hypothetical protein